MDVILNRKGNLPLVLPRMKKRVCDSDYQIKQVFMCKNTSSKEGDLVDILINSMMKSIFVYEA